MAGEPKATVTLHGTVQDIIKNPLVEGPEQIQIAVDEAEPLYREIRIDNALQTDDGGKVALKPGAEVEVKVEAPLDPALENDTKA